MTGKFKYVLIFLLCFFGMMFLNKVDAGATQFEIDSVDINVPVTPSFGETVSPGSVTVNSITSSGEDRKANFTVSAGGQTSVQKYNTEYTLTMLITLSSADYWEWIMTTVPTLSVKVNGSAPKSVALKDSTESSPIQVEYVFTVPAPTISFDLNGGSGGPSAQTTDADGKIALSSLEKPTKTNAVFQGWTLSGASVDDSKVYTGAATLTAAWQQLYTVSFDSQGGSSIASQVADASNKLASLPTPTRSGYTFGGWYQNASFTGSAVTASYTYTQNTTLYAKWTADATVAPTTAPTTTAPSASDDETTTEETTSEETSGEDSGEDSEAPDSGEESSEENNNGTTAGNDADDAGETPEPEESSPETTSEEEPEDILPANGVDNSGEKKFPIVPVAAGAGALGLAALAVFVIAPAVKGGAAAAGAAGAVTMGEAAAAAGTAAATAAGTVGGAAAAKKAAELAFEDHSKAVLTCLRDTSENNAFCELLKSRVYLNTTRISYEEFDSLEEKVGDEEPDIVIMELLSMDELEKVSEKMDACLEAYEDAGIGLILSAETEKLLKDFIREKKKENVIVSTVLSEAGEHAKLTKLILPLYKPDITLENSVEAIGTVADALGVPLISVITNVFLNGKDIKETIEGGDLSALDSATIIGDIASILGFDAVADVAGFVNDANDAKDNIMKHVHTGEEEIEAPENEAN